VSTDRRIAQMLHFIGRSRYSRENAGRSAASTRRYSFQPSLVATATPPRSRGIDHVRCPPRLRGARRWRARMVGRLVASQGV
jgi:hypothetical protein